MTLSINFGKHYWMSSVKQLGSGRSSELFWRLVRTKLFVYTIPTNGHNKGIIRLCVLDHSLQLCWDIKIYKLRKYSLNKWKSLLKNHYMHLKELWKKIFQSHPCPILCLDHLEKHSINSENVWYEHFSVVIMSNFD